MSPITGKLRLAFSAIRDILRNNKSGYSAVWSSAFDWGSKGREFKSLYPDHFIINELRRFFRTEKSAFFTLKQYNQNHRLSRWYAPRLQGDIAGSPTRALKKFANCNFFTGRR